MKHRARRFARHVWLAVIAILAGLSAAHAEGRRVAAVPALP